MKKLNIEPKLTSKQMKSTFLFTKQYGKEKEEFITITLEVDYIYKHFGISPTLHEHGHFDFNVYDFLFIKRIKAVVSLIQEAIEFAEQELGKQNVKS